MYEKLLLLTNLSYLIMSGMSLDAMEDLGLLRGLKLPLKL